MKLETQYSRIFRQETFDSGVETEIVVSKGINMKTFNVEQKAFPISCVGLRVRKTLAVFLSTGL